MDIVLVEINALIAQVEMDHFLAYLCVPHGQTESSSLCVQGSCKII